jgi:ubiquinone/menaquinone biosynthesis C-methylase UbiE
MSEAGVNLVCSDQCAPSGWKGQFIYPRGRLGALVGHLMGIKNAGMNRFAVEMLDIQPDDQVLEIGFAHGKAVRLAAEAAKEGAVAGIDLSPTMVEQARRRNDDLVRAGRVELIRGSVSALSFDEGRFHKVFAVNNYQFWPQPLEDLRGVLRVMRSGGTFLVCARMRHPTRRIQLAPGFTDEQIDRVRSLMASAGFRTLRTARRQLGRTITCVLGDK